MHNNINFNICNNYQNIYNIRNIFKNTIATWTTAAIYTTISIATYATTTSTPTTVIAPIKLVLYLWIILTRNKFVLKKSQMKFYFSFTFHVTNAKNKSASEMLLFDIWRCTESDLWAKLLFSAILNGWFMNTCTVKAT